MPVPPIPQNEPLRLAELDRYAVLRTRPDEAFDRITNLAARLFGCPMSRLNFVTGEQEWCKSRSGPGYKDSPRSDSFCAWAILSDSAMVVPDARQDPRFSANIHGTGKEAIRFYAGAPLISSNGLNLGTLCILDTAPHPGGLNAEEIVTLTDLAAIAMTLLEERAGARDPQRTFTNLCDAGKRAAALGPPYSESQFRATFEMAPLGFVLTHIDGRFIESNEAYRNITGYSEEDLSSIIFISLTHPDEIENNRELFRRLTTQQIESYVLEKRILQKSGAIRWVRSHARLLREPGQPTKVIGMVEDITQRKQADARYSFLAESIPQMVWTATADGMLDYVNRRGCEFFGVAQEELLGGGWLGWVHPDDQAKAISRWTYSLQTGEAYETEFRLKRGLDAAWRLHLVRALPFAGEGGKVTQWFGTCTDIEDQNQAVRQIDDDRRRWRELLVNTPAGIAILRGADHTYEWVNPHYARLVGRSAEALANKTLLEGLPEMKGQIYRRLLDNVYRSGEPAVGHESPVQVDRGAGFLENIYVNFVYLPTRSPDGNIDGVFVHVLDVTDTVAARKRIEESESQFRTLAETIPHLAWMADETGNIFWYNRRWFDYTGSTLEEMQGWGWKKVHDPSVLGDVLERWGNALSSGSPFEMTFPLRRSDGEFRTFLTRVEPIKDSSGNVVRWFGTNTDITTQRRTEEQLRRINRELEEFSYVASHDLQEPLRMVNIYSQLLLENVDGAKDELAQYCVFVGDGVKRMEALIHDLLMFSRSVHAEELPVGPANLSEALSEALDVLKNRIENLGAVITAPALPATLGDTQQMAHVFQNIISNALKYRKKSAVPTIQISAEREADRWIIAVKDNGIGFEPQYAERIFGLFKRLHKEEYPGTGLGLAICKRIVERYGGRMWAESSLGEGAIFYFSLPAADPRE